jgi:hypothetical protein
VLVNVLVNVNDAPPFIALFSAVPLTLNDVATLIILPFAIVQPLDAVHFIPAVTASGSP